MKNIFLLLAFILLTVSNAFSQWQLREAVELRESEGLPNFFKKVNENKPIKIGYIGDSSTDASYGWAYKFADKLMAKYQLSDVSTYNIAVGGTNSQYGVFITDKRLLDDLEDLDLVFISYSINDSYISGDECAKSIEGIIRKIWKKNPNTDICFFYSMVSYNSPTLFVSASVHDSIGGYYGIPAINPGFEGYSAISTDTVVRTGTVDDFDAGTNSEGVYLFTKDGNHPTNYGHNVWADVVIRAIERLEGSAKEVTHELKTPIMLDNYHYAKAFHLDDTKSNGMEKVTETGVYDFLDSRIESGLQFMISTNPEEYYEYTFTGHRFGFNFLTGPAVGTFVIEIDGEKEYYDAFDSYSFYWRGTRIIRDVPYGEHHVKIYANGGHTLEEKRSKVDNSYKSYFDADPTAFTDSMLVLSEFLLLDEEVTLGVNEEKVNFSIAPNPSKGYIRVHFSGKNTYDELKIYNSLGMKIISEPILNKKQLDIDMSRTVPGIYFVVVGDEVKRLIIE